MGPCYVPGTVDGRSQLAVGSGTEVSAEPHDTGRPMLGHV